ncbi:MAG: hypothetical protein P3X23_007530 [Thermosynechococcus sp. Uc]|nr:hypothetical protein [Thermosynechococcus sp. Uc]
MLVASGLATSFPWSADAVPQPYPQLAVSSFMDMCIERGRRSAPIVPRSVMNNICQCSINYIQQRVSYADFQTLSQPQSPRQQQAQRVVDESVNYCIRQQLGV